MYHKPNISLENVVSIDNGCCNAYIYFGVFAIFSAIPNQNEAYMGTTNCTTLKVSYTAWQKHKKRGDLTFYCRVREAGQPPLDVCLHTTNKAQADAFVMLRKRELELYNAQLLVGENPDASKLLRRSTSKIAQKGTSETVSVRTAVDAWSAHLSRSGKRPATISTYLRAMRNCIDYTLPLTALTDKYLNEALRKHDHLKAATRKSYCVTVREFIKFCCREYGLNRDLIDCFTFIKVQTEEKGFWTMNEMRMVIDNVQCRDEASTQCYKAYFWLMATTGARQGEAAALEWSDLRDGAVTFRAETTKSGQTRTCPLTIGVLDLLNRLPRVSKKIFAYIGNQQASRFAVLSKAVEKAGVRPGGLHTFRHSASMYLYSKISDIKLVSQILGHSASTALTYYQKTREVDKVSDAITEAYDGENNLPSLMDWFVENDLI